MTGLGHDLRYRLRQLGRAPGFVALAALTLALGIGANSAMFSEVNAALLRPLPYPDPGSLVSVLERRPDASRSLVTFPNFADWRTERPSIGAMTIFREQAFNLGGRAMALGARRTEILRLVVGDSMMPVAIGVGVGLVGAAGLSRFLGSLLYAVAPLEPSTFAAMSAVLAAVGLAACLLPARRATRVDPMRAIRGEG